jgi:hypothetical protein
MEMLISERRIDQTKAKIARQQVRQNTGRQSHLYV